MYTLHATNWSIVCHQRVEMLPDEDVSGPWCLASCVL